MGLGLFRIWKYGWMKTIYFVRHGQTRFNQERRLQGWNDSPLSETGEEQARHMAKALSPLGIRYALISPLGRARQTASIIQSEIGIELEPVPELKEVSFGVFEGNTLDQLDEKFPGLWQRRQADKWNYCPPQGEANKDAVPRAKEIVARIEQWIKPEPLLIIAHFAINRIILALLAGLEPEETIRMDVPHLALYRARKENGSWHVGYQDTEAADPEFQSGWLRQDDPARPMGG